jgi:hypothetical protein
MESFINMPKKNNRLEDMSSQRELSLNAICYSRDFGVQPHLIAALKYILY